MICFDILFSKEHVFVNFIDLRTFVAKSYCRDFRTFPADFCTFTIFTISTFLCLQLYIGWGAEGCYAHTWRGKLNHSIIVTWKKGIFIFFNYYYKEESYLYIFQLFLHGRKVLIHLYFSIIITWKKITRIFLKTWEWYGRGHFLKFGLLPNLTCASKLINFSHSSLQK